MHAKTRPSINQLPLMNRHNLEKKEVRLGLAQIVAVLGLTVGSILAAFCLGFYSGRSVAFERELSNALASLPKFPVNTEQADHDISDQIATEIYAKLNARPEESMPSAGELQKDNVFPDLATIEEAQIADEDLAAVLELDKENDAEGAAIFDDFDKQESRTLKEERALSALFKEQVNEEVKEEATPVAVRQPTVKVEPTAIPVQIKSVASGWYAQVAAPKLMQDANVLTINLKKSGFKSVIEEAEVRGEKYYRVLVGPESSKAQAEVLLQQLKREPYIDSDPFLKVVK